MVAIALQAAVTAYVPASLAVLAPARPTAAVIALAPAAIRAPVFAAQADPAAPAQAIPVPADPVQAAHAAVAAPAWEYVHAHRVTAIARPSMFSLASTQFLWQKTR